MLLDLKSRTDIDVLKKTAVKDPRNKDINLMDFIDCIDNLHQAAMAVHPVDLRFDTSTGLDVKSGIIKNVSVSYDDSFSSDCKLTIELQENATMQPITYDFNCLPENFEVNTMSKPGSHFKFYINDADRQVMVGIIIYLNR